MAAREAAVLVATAVLAGCEPCWNLPPWSCEDSITREEGELVADLYARALAYPDQFVGHIRSNIDERKNHDVSHAAGFLAGRFRAAAAELPDENESAEMIYDIGSSAGVPPDIQQRTVDDMRQERAGYQTTAALLDDLRSSVDEIVTRNQTSGYDRSDLKAGGAYVQQWAEVILSGPDAPMTLSEFQRFFFLYLSRYMLAAAGYGQPHEGR